MHTTSFIRRHLTRLPLGKLFTTRDLLLYGRRSAIDQAIYRLVKCGTIIRLARGVFVKNGSDLSAVTVTDVARIKAQSFGRSIAIWAGNIARDLGLIKETCTCPVFWVNSSSSSFLCGNTRVYFKKCCARKMNLGESFGMKAMNALWHLGSDQVGRSEINTIWEKCGRTHREDIRCSLNWLPAWLGQYFLDRTVPLSFLKNYPSTA